MNSGSDHIRKRLFSFSSSLCGLLSVEQSVMSVLQSSRFLLVSRTVAAATKRRLWRDAKPIASVPQISSMNSCVFSTPKRNNSNSCVEKVPSDVSSMAATESQDTTAIAKEFIASLGHSDRIAQGVVDALVKSGLSGTALLSTIKSLAGRVEVGEDGGLEDLIHSVEQELARTDGKQVVTFYCVPPGTNNNGEKQQGFPIQAFEGMTLTDVARFGGVASEDNENHNNLLLGEYIECACSGVMACSTCHVVIDKDWYDKVGEPSDAEQDMIDLAYEPTSTSRLGCQVVLTPELDGLVIKIPGGANNMMDFIPFED